METDCRTCIPSVRVISATLSPTQRQFVIEQKALTYRVRENRPTLALQTKGVRAIWDPDLGPGGGWRCPEGTRYGGQITDRFGRGCGGGIIRRVGRALVRAGQGLDELGLGRDMRRLERAAQRRGRAQQGAARIRRGAERVALAQEALAQRLVGDWQPGDGGRRTRRNLPGGPAQRTSLVPRAPKRRRIVKPEARKTPRRQGQTPRRRPVRERVAIAQERLARRLVGEPEISPRTRRTPTRDIEPEAALERAPLPEVPETTLPVTSSARRSRTTPKPTPVGIPPASRRRWNAINQEDSATDGVVYILNESPISDSLRRAGFVNLSISQREAVDKAARKIHADLAEKWRVALSLAQPPTVGQVFDAIDWKNATAEQARDFAKYEITLNPGQWRDAFYRDIWSSSEREQLMNAMRRSSRSVTGDRIATPRGTEPENFWRRRYAKRLGRGAEQKKNYTDQELLDAILPKGKYVSAGTTYNNLLYGHGTDNLDELQSIIERRLDDLEKNNDGRIADYMKDGLAARWRGALRAVAHERKRRLLQKNRLIENSRAEAIRAQKGIPEPKKNVGPRVIPALIPNNQRLRFGEPLAPENYLEGELALAPDIANSDIRTVDDAVLALDAGVPIEKIPQQFWLDALYMHMDPQRRNVKQYKRLGKNGGICKDGERGDLLILDKLDKDGNTTGTGLVIGWEAYRGGLGKNGFVNNAGEVIGWNLANALGLNVEPARFDGIFRRDGNGLVRDRAGIAFAIPFAWNRAPDGEPVQHYEDFSDYPPNFHPEVVEDLPDKGYPQRLAHDLFVALIGVDDRHNQNWMGGRFGGNINGQAFLAPMDLGWGGNTIYGFRDFVDTQIDEENDITYDIVQHLNSLDTEEAELLRENLAQVYDTIMESAQAIVRRGSTQFVENIILGMHLESYTDLSEEDREELEDIVRSTASRWFDALANNVDLMQDERAVLFEDWGIDPDRSYAAPLNPDMQATRTPDSEPENAPDVNERFPRARAVKDAARKVIQGDLDERIVSGSRLADAGKKARILWGRQRLEFLDGDGPAVHPVHVFKIDETGEYLLLTGKEKDFLGRELKFPNNTALQWVEDITSLKARDIDPTDSEMIDLYVRTSIGGDDLLLYEEKLHELAGTGDWSDLYNEAKKIIQGDSEIPENAWEIYDNLRKLSSFEWARVISGNFTSSRDHESAAKAALIGNALPLLEGRLTNAGIERPVSRRLSNSSQRAITALRPKRPKRTKKVPPFADVRPFETGRIVVPEPIIKSNIKNLDDAINAFSNGIPLTEIPEEFWYAVLDDYIATENIRDGRQASRDVREVVKNDGAIKVVRQIEEFNDDGQRLDQGFVMVKDDNPLGQAGEVIGWNLMNALGINVGPARVVGRPGEQWVALPHAFNNGPSGRLNRFPGRATPRTSPSDDDESFNFFEDINAGRNYNIDAFADLPDKGLPQRVAAVLSQFIMDVPDRHYNNALAGQFQPAIGGPEAMAIPIDLGWVGTAYYDDIEDMTNRALFFDKHIFEDAVKFMASQRVTQAEKERVAREIVQIVDEMIRRQRAIIARGIDAFIEDAKAQFPLPANPTSRELDKHADQLLYAVTKAGQIYDALVRSDRLLSEGEYQRILEMLGITGILGTLPFPGENKSFNIAYLRNKKLQSNFYQQFQQRMLIGGHNG